MAIEHKFLSCSFDTDFRTTNAILSKTPYDPEVLILGTFNPKTNEKANVADFFYGRNWFWPAFFNVLKHKEIYYTKQRRFNKPFEPNLIDIFHFCKEFKLTFADMIGQVLYNNGVDYELNGNVAILNGEEYNLIKDGDLADLNALNQVDWKHNEIIDFIEKTISINTIILTRKPVDPFLYYWQKISTHNYNRRISFRNIFTPSAQGLRGRPRINCLIKHWLFNDDTNYDRLDTNWLNQNGVDINIFLNKYCQDKTIT